MSISGVTDISMWEVVGEAIYIQHWLQTLLKEERKKRRLRDNTTIPNDLTNFHSQAAEHSVQSINDIQTKQSPIVKGY